jgi:hypothetical protein
MIDTDRGHSKDEAIASARWLGPTILRVAGWPIESLEALRSQGLTKRIDDWIHNETQMRQASDVLAAELYKIVPRLRDRTIRRLALELKRHLHGSVGPLPERLTESLLKDDMVRLAIGPAIVAALGQRDKHAAERADIELAYAVELERASAALDGLVSEDRFQRALSLASPSLFGQWQNSREGSTSRRGRLRLQSTVHRYLMRAIGRATPNGLWAGVALEDMTEAALVPLQLADAPSVVRVSPALSVFARGQEYLSHRRPWIEKLTWRRNPTLKRINEEAWELGTFAGSSWSVRRIAHHVQLEFLVGWLSLADRSSLREIEAALCDRVPGMTSHLACRLCEIWIDAGILWSAACLPAFFADAWQALEAMIETLPPSEQPLWRACRTRLRQIAEKIEPAIDAIEPRALRDLFDEAHQCVDAVLCRYEAAPPRGEDVLVIDRTAPFRFSVSRDLVNSIEQKLRSYWTFDRYGLGEIETRITIDHFFGGIPHEACISLDELLSRGAETDPAQRAWSWEERVLSKASPVSAKLAREAFARWEQELEDAVEDHIHCLATDRTSEVASVLPPGSALLLLGQSDGRPLLRIGGLTPEPSFFYSRFSGLFDKGDAFRTWQRATIAEMTARWPGLRFLDLAIRNHLNPNVTARPPVAAAIIDPLDTESRLLREGRITSNRNGRPLLFASAGSTELLIPSARSAAYLGGLDRIASVLASVSFFLGRPPLLAPLPRLTREIECWHHLPRLMLDDAIVSPERWTPGTSLGTTLANARGAERLIQWRRFVLRVGLPDLVYTFQGRHQTESLLATDSAIAVELLCQELQAHGPAIRMQEVFPTPESFVVRDREGRRYVAELAVPWSADDAFWRDYVEGVSTDELRAELAG